MQVLLSQSLQEEQQNDDRSTCEEALRCLLHLWVAAPRLAPHSCRCNMSLVAVRPTRNSQRGQHGGLRRM